MCQNYLYKSTFYLHFSQILTLSKIIKICCDLFECLFAHGLKWRMMELRIFNITDILMLYNCFLFNILKLFKHSGSLCLL